MTEYMSKEECTRWKSRLTRAQNTGKPEKVVSVCTEFLARERDGVALPDFWHRFQTARDDALWQIARNRTA